MPKQLPTIRNRVWIAGKFIDRDPYPSVSPTRFETLTTTSSTGMRLDRPIFGGPADPVYPNVREQFEIALPWSNALSAELLDWIDTLRFLSTSFPVGIWKQTYSVWDGDGVKKDFYAWRRQALPVVTPATEWQDYPTFVDLFDSGIVGNPVPSHTTDANGAISQDRTLVPTADASIDSGTPGADEVWVSNEGRIVNGLRVTKVRFGTAPAAGRNVARICFIPLLECLIRGVGQISYDQVNKETRSIALTEAF